MPNNHLKEIRKAQGLPLLGLAVMAKVSTTTLVAIERWDHLPGPVVRQRIADTLRVRPVEIWPDLEVAGGTTG